jgi:hypothetical protein
LRRRLSLIIAAALLGASLLPAGVSAAGAISVGYQTTANITPGSILSLTSSARSSVEPATNTGHASALVGVAVSSPVLALSGTAANVQVAVGGIAEVLVSDINGPVSAGDKITASPITGVGMKAAVAGQIIGTAQSALSSVTTSSRSVKDLKGKATTVKAGLIPVAINVGYYSGSASGALSAFVPSFLQDLANTIAGKPVAPARVLFAFLILLLGFITVSVMLNAAIRSGIISLGRNPLAGSALRKGLVDVILAALGILLITGVIVYAILAY